MKLKALSFSTLLFFFGSAAQAAQVIYKNMYAAHNLVQGRGKTRDLAKKDAESAIPSGFVADPGNSPTFQCRIAGTIAGDKCSDPKDEVLFTVALIKKD